MEGLIPMVYKAIRRTKTRRQYECLSSGASQSYNVTDFYVNGQSHVYMKSSTDKIAGFPAERNGHRRHKSVEDFSFEFSVPDQDRTKGASPPFPKQLVRFRSHRMFSCVTGA